MSVSFDISCDECGTEISDMDEVYCEKCAKTESKLNERIQELEAEVAKLRAHCFDLLVGAA